MLLFLLLISAKTLMLASLELCWKQLNNFYLLTEQPAFGNILGHLYVFITLDQIFISVAKMETNGYHLELFWTEFFFNNKNTSIGFFFLNIFYLKRTCYFRPGIIV